MLNTSSLLSYNLYKIHFDLPNPGYQRPSVIKKKWPDGRIRACAGIDYESLKDEADFDTDLLRDSLRSNDIAIWNGLSESEKNEWWGEPADMVYDMYLWSWWGAQGNRSAIHLHHFKDMNLITQEIVAMMRVLIFHMLI